MTRNREKTSVERETSLIQVLWAWSKNELLRRLEKFKLERRGIFSRSAKWRFKCQRYKQLDHSRTHMSFDSLFRGLICHGQEPLINRTTIQVVDWMRLEQKWHLRLLCHYHSQVFEWTKKDSFMLCTIMNVNGLLRVGVEPGFFVPVDEAREVQEKCWL